MARYGVTFEKVATIAAELISQGINPTVDRVRTQLGTGSKSTIAKHLKRWRIQAEFSEQPGVQYDPDQIPEELLTLMRDFWQRFTRTQLADEHARKAMTAVSTGSPPASSLMNTASNSSEASQSLSEQMQLIQDYVVGLEAELAESMALQQRLAYRLGAFYQTGEPSTDTAKMTPTADTRVAAHQSGPVLADLVDPKIHAMPILAELSAVQAALDHAEVTHHHLSEDLDWATRSAFNLASTKADLQQALHHAHQQLDANAVREAALLAENSALKEQIGHLRSALAHRQRFIERLEGEVLSFKPTEAAATQP
jgi:septal ring factor EnvC (AmiA/AmiB activator)